MSNAVIVSTARTGFGKSWRGAFNMTYGATLGGHVVQQAVARAGIDPAEVEDVLMGCALTEGTTGGNIARQIALRAGLPESTGGVTVNRFCSSGLQAIALAADSIRSGRAQAALAGGTESMSMIPGTGNKFSANPWLIENHADAYLSMGLTAENVARKYGITREQGDEFALGSHRKALAAIEAERFKDEIVPVAVTNTTATANPAKPEVKTSEFKRDEGPRADTSAEALARLKPVFHAKGSVTAGNSSQTSDGAAAAIVISEERAKQLGIQPMARFVSFATAGCPPEEMGIGPVHAIPKALKLAGLTLDQIDLIELNEAFAAQALAVIQQAGLDPAKVNVNGGAIALGHPLGCTGAKLTATLLYEMKRRNLRYGLVTMCVGGGMGAAGIFECLN